MMPSIAQHHKKFVAQFVAWLKNLETYSEKSYLLSVLLSIRSQVRILSGSPINQALTALQELNRRSQKIRQLRVYARWRLPICSQFVASPSVHSDGFVSTRPFPRRHLRKFQSSKAVRFRGDSKSG